MKIKKAIPFILPLAVWLSITGYMALLMYVLTPLTISLEMSEGFRLICFIVSMVLQGVIVWALTFAAAKKFGLGVKGTLAALPVMFALFAVYRVPTQYLFVYTGEWSFMFNHNPAMNRFLAAFWITLQFGIIMLVTATAVYANSKPEAIKNTTGGNHEA